MIRMKQAQVPSSSRGRAAARTYDTVLQRIIEGANCSVAPTWRKSARSRINNLDIFRRLACHCVILVTIAWAASICAR
jgi:hypothetical protein